jgi:Fur family ferric uptake transcriptional regulator
MKTWPIGLKRTASRLAVLQRFEQSPKALSVAQLSSELPDIHITTLYRIIESFLEHDLIQLSDQFQPKEKHYLLKSHTHRHTLRCVKCGKMVPLKHCPVHLDTEIEGFAVLNHRLEIEGLCPECRKETTL